ncbi:MAG: ABC transporter substrate-binding protein [Dehalococcoidia bacterium]|nr:ABC transporter substrate-binding protein [Dehalococcoidia bacterium]
MVTLAGAGAAALVGCGGDDDDNGSEASQTEIRTATPIPPSSSVKRGGVHVAPWETEPLGQLDPHLMKSGFVNSATYAVYNGLIRQDNADLNNLQGELADSWENPDQVTFTFKLRQGVKFHDGTDFNAEVMKWNVERIISPGFVMEGKYTGAAAGLIKVEVLDTYTIKFTFDKPKVNSIEAFYWTGQGISGAVSRTAGEAAGKDLWKAPVGTGPFKLTKWDTGSKITFERNPDYFEKLNGEALPFADRFEQIALPDPAVRAINLKNGQLSSSPFPASSAKDLKDEGFEVITGGLDALGFYPNHQGGVFKDARLRRAVAYGIDRQALAQTVFFGLAQPNVGMPKASKWADATYTGFPYDPKRAKDEMAAAGVPDGFEFEAMVLPTGDRPKAVEFMQAQLASIGTRVKITPTESAAYVERLMVRGEGDTFFASTGLLGLTESGSFEASAVPNPGRKQNPNDQKMIDYVTRISATFDVDERRKLIQEAQKYYWDELVAIIPVVDYTPPQVMGKGWTNLDFVPPFTFFPDYKRIAQKA